MNNEDEINEVKKERQTIIDAFQQAFSEAVLTMWETHPKVMIEVCNGTRRLSCSVEGDDILLHTELAEEKSNIITSVFN